MIITVKYKGHFNHLVVITVGILQPTVRYNFCGLNINFMRKYLLISLTLRIVIMLWTVTKPLFFIVIYALCSIYCYILSIPASYIPELLYMWLLFMRKYLLISLIIAYCYNALDCYNLTPLGCLYVMFSGTTGGSYFQDCLQFFIYFIFNTQILWNLVVKSELIVCNS